MSGAFSGDLREAAKNQSVSRSGKMRSKVSAMASAGPSTGVGRKGYTNVPQSVN